MTAAPEEWVRLQGYGEMTLRTSVATVMAIAPNERGGGGDLQGARRRAAGAKSEIAELASSWDIEATPNLRSPRLVPEQHWPDIVREAPLPALIVAFVVGVSVAGR
ncbi:hypothetical protein [Bradyrhizobium symbiodeficiens]|uniref:hypothetical protein n=1 Tax=Bradyrhizobium symbiodeficiens TaxID=1404367 RepID=UPI001FCE3606|nr:hypothetical protein [Bradyrhizobium symbiodeficiens]